MRKTILVGGQAGQGVNKTSSLIGQVFNNLGYYVFIYRDYPSLIQGGHNFNVLTISDKPVFSHRRSLEVIIALDDLTIEKHASDLQPEGFILGSAKRKKHPHLISIDMDSISLPSTTVGRENNVLVGGLMKLWGLPLEAGFQAAKEEFSKTEKIEEALDEGWQMVAQREKIPSIRQAKETYFFTGTEGVSQGAIAAGLDVYFAYPMTPATGVLHQLAAQQREYDFLVAQLENEIAVVNAALGASFTGARSMVGTSGGGFALMSEGLSLAGMTELPLVVYLAQRTAPATGVPTYTSQGDLKFALNVGHGEFPRIVVAPGEAEEAFQRTIEAFYLSQKYRLLSIILGDKHLAESYFSFDRINPPRVKMERFLTEEDQSGDKSYQITPQGISPRLIPGEGAFVRASGYEHDEEGFTIEDGEGTRKMNDKRWAKLPALRKEIDRLQPVKTYGRGKNLIIGWGSTKGAILDSLVDLPDYRFLQISYLSPFPISQVAAEMEKAKKIILVENNVTGLLGQVIREQTGFVIEKQILKYDGRPFTPEEIIQRVKEL
jgi:2-oxoglutarate/2-oxoacid ferredoxin oxidoreductase subunit alpha